MAAMVCGCGQMSDAMAPEVSVTQLGPFDGAAKSPDCNVPILYAEPKGGFKKIAIVEGWGTEEQRIELITALDKKACELGADSLLVVSDTAQHTDKLVYDPANQQPGEQGDRSISNSKAQEINQKEHVARIGEKGHSGYYIETYALVFDTKK